MEDVKKIQPNMLKGIVSVPPSKSVAHRAIIAAIFLAGSVQLKMLQFQRISKQQLNVCAHWALNAASIQKV